MKRYRRTCDDGSINEGFAQDDDEIRRQTSEYMETSGSTSCKTEVIDDYEENTQE